MTVPQWRTCELFSVWDNLPLYIVMTPCKHSTNIVITRNFLGSFLILYNYDIHSTNIDLAVLFYNYNYYILSTYI